MAHLLIKMKSQGTASVVEQTGRGVTRYSPGDGVDQNIGYGPEVLQQKHSECQGRQKDSHSEQRPAYFLPAISPVKGLPDFCAQSKNNNSQHEYGKHTDSGLLKPVHALPFP